MGDQIEKFYLIQKGKNVITKDLLNRFITANPELTPFFEKRKIELRPLEFSHFESWTYWIISQQLSGKVADILINRFRATCEQVTPSNVLSIESDKLRNIGISRSKIEYLKNIAKFHYEGKHIVNFETYSSDEIRDHYSKIKGIGPWTINMFLIFNLTRLDILAVNDLVVRKGIKEMYGLDAVPNVKQASQIGQKWGDLATIGTLLAWEVVGS